MILMLENDMIAYLATKEYIFTVNFCLQFNDSLILQSFVQKTKNNQKGVEYAENDVNFFCLPAHFFLLLLDYCSICLSNESKLHV